MVLGVTYRARQLYNELFMTIHVNGEEAMLENLIDWLSCATCTLTFDAFNNPAQPIVNLSKALPSQHCSPRSPSWPSH
jgi:hypothetical protein